MWWRPDGMIFSNPWDGWQDLLPLSLYMFVVVIVKLLWTVIVCILILGPKAVGKVKCRWVSWLEAHPFGAHLVSIPHEMSPPPSCPRHGLLLSCFLLPFFRGHWWWDWERDVYHKPQNSMGHLQGPQEGKKVWWKMTIFNDQQPTKIWALWMRLWGISWQPITDMFMCIQDHCGARTLWGN